MILPSKHLTNDRALLGVGAAILGHLDEDRTVSELWERVRADHSHAEVPPSFDWYVLALAFLHAIAAIDYHNGVISSASRQ